MLADFGTGNAHRTNKDDLRAMLHNGKWSRENEKFVLQVRDQIITAALTTGKHALVDDTNLAPKHEERLRQLAREAGAGFSIVDFTHVSVEECIERDRKRQNYVGEKVIRDMYNQFLRPKIDPPARNPKLLDAIIVDIDGTVAQMNGRGPFEWSRVGEDLPRDVVWNTIWGLADNGSEIIFMSGRDECCRKETIDWINNNLSAATMKLFMRPAGDQRKDSIVKLELYRQNIEGKYNVVAIFDDRASICRVWDEIGFGDRLFRVGPIDRDDF